MTELPVTIRARKLLANSHKWGGAVEAGIRSGAWDHGSKLADFLNEAEQELLREQMEENCPDD
jgi:hypothetical protein